MCLSARSSQPKGDPWCGNTSNGKTKSIDLGKFITNANSQIAILWIDTLTRITQSPCNSWLILSLKIFSHFPPSKVGNRLLTLGLLIFQGEGFKGICQGLKPSIPAVCFDRHAVKLKMMERLDTCIKQVTLSMI